ncbi:S-layer homology domain-containing protein, partial [Pseudarthrobacter oxydans]
AGSPAYVPSATSPFTDIATNHAFYKEITWLAATGISNGWTEPDGTKTYRPTLAVSREAMAAFMYRLAGSPAYVPSATSPFTDIATNHAFYKEITWLAANGISNGWTEPDGTKTYRPTLAVSREAMAAFMYRLSAARLIGDQPPA